MRRPRPLNGWRSTNIALVLVACILLPNTGKGQGFRPENTRKFFAHTEQVSSFLRGFDIHRQQTMRPCLRTNLRTERSAGQLAVRAGASETKDAFEEAMAAMSCRRNGRVQVNTVYDALMEVLISEARTQAQSLNLDASGNCVLRYPRFRNPDCGPY